MKLFKKIRRIILVVNIVYTVMFIVGFILLLGEAGIIEIGDTSVSNSDSDFSITITDPKVKEVMTKSDSEVWSELTGGLLTSKPSEKLPSNASEIEQAVNKKMTDIIIPIRQWEDSSDDTNLNTKQGETTITVNSFLKEFWMAFFNDLYTKCPKFVISSVGCFRIDGVGYGQVGYKSAHTYGAAVDINPYDEGNPYGSTAPYTKSEWEKLPENHLKYQIIYSDSPMAQLAKAYTLDWGGTWPRGTYDIMHFSFIADYQTRADWIQSSNS